MKFRPSLITTLLSIAVFVGLCFVLLHFLADWP